MERPEQVLSFLTEWFDPGPQIVKQFVLKYYCETSEVEMREIATSGRKFLRRTKVPTTSISRSDLIVGGHILLFSRNLKIVDYADNATRELLEVAAERTVVVVSPALYGQTGDIVATIERAGFTIVDVKGLHLGREEAHEAQTRFGMDVDADDAPPNNNSGGGITVAVALQGRDSIDKVRLTVSLSEYSSHGGRGKQVVCANDAESASQFHDFFFTRCPPAVPTYSTNCTCCVIKPHAIKSRKGGEILDAILTHGTYRISAVRLFRLESSAAAAEFLEVYDGGVVTDFHLLVDEMCSGPVIALEVQGGGDNDGEGETVVQSFRRDVAGPYDVDMARELYPETIRARFGRDNVQSGVHCTDLPRDGRGEVEFFFDILAGDRVPDVT